MGNILESLDQVLNSEGVTSDYRRKDDDAISHTFEKVNEMSENQLDQLEKQIAARRERLQMLKEQNKKSNPYRYPE